MNDPVELRTTHQAFLLADQTQTSHVLANMLRKVFWIVDEPAQKVSYSLFLGMDDGRVQTLAGSNVLLEHSSQFTEASLVGPASVAEASVPSGPGNKDRDYECVECDEGTNSSPAITGVGRSE
jgi:hypothetical protein